MASNDQIDKIISIRFNNSELIDGIQAAKSQIEAINGEVNRYKEQLKDLSKAEESNLKILKDATSSNYERRKAQEALTTIQAKQEEISLALTEAEEKQIVQTRALSDVQRQYQKELQNNIKIQTATEGSLTQMRAQLSNLRAAYQSASEAGRAQLLPQINELKNKIKEADSAIQEYNSNVGNYKNDILEALGVNDLFTKSLNMLKSPLGALIGLAGGITAAFKLYKESIHSTQQTGDAYDRAMAGWRNTWELFKKSVATVDFTFFVNNAAAAAAAGRDLQSVLDGLFERTNSINIQEASLRKENAQLLVDMRDVNKSLEERKTAGEKFMENEINIAKQREEAAKDERDAQLENLFALTNAREFASKEEREQAKQEFADKIKLYNLNLDQIKAVEELNKAEETKKTTQDLISKSAVYNDAMTALQKKQTQAVLDAQHKLRDLAGDHYYDFIDFVKQYNLTNDEQVKAYVAAEIKYQQAGASYIETNQRVLTTINSLTKAQEKATVKAAKRNNVDKEYTKIQESIKKLSEDIYTLTLDAMEETRTGELQRIDAQKEHELSAIDEAIAANAAAREKNTKNGKIADVKLNAFLLVEYDKLEEKKTLLTEQFASERADIEKKWNKKAFDDMIAERAKEMANASLEDQLRETKFTIENPNDREGILQQKRITAVNELTRAQEELARITTMGYEEMGISAEDYTEKVNKAKSRVLNAQGKLSDIDQKSIDIEEKKTKASLAGASAMVSALANVAESAGASQGAVKAMAIATAAAGMAESIYQASKAGPFPGNLVAIAAAVAQFASLITTIRALTQESDSQKYAKGGLIPVSGNAGVIQGPSHAGGGVPLSLGGKKVGEVEGGELLAIVNKKDTEQLQALSRINSAHGVKFANGGMIDWSGIYRSLNVTPGYAIQAPNIDLSGSDRAIVQAIRAGFQEATAVVTVKDIDTARKRVQVADGLSKFSRKARRSGSLS